MSTDLNQTRCEVYKKTKSLVFRMCELFQKEITQGCRPNSPGVGINLLLTFKTSCKVIRNKQMQLNNEHTFTARTQRHTTTYVTSLR